GRGKARKVGSLGADFSGTVWVVVPEYRGLKVGELQELRRRLRPRGIEYHIVKNSLFARAADQSGKGELRSLLAGPTAVAIGDGDEVELAKSLVDETRVLKTLKILGALIGGGGLGAGGVVDPRDRPVRQVPSGPLGRFRGAGRGGSRRRGRRGRGARGGGGEDRVHGHSQGDGRVEDQRDQDRPRAHRARPQGGEGP